MVPQSPELCNMQEVLGMHERTKMKTVGGHNRADLISDVGADSRRGQRRMDEMMFKVCER